MKNISKTILISFIGIISLFGIFISLNKVKAQQSQPQFLFSWKATNSYSPLSFIGKSLPTSQSKISATFELILNGKPVDISGQNIYWYLNNNLIGGGIGTQGLIFPLFGLPPQMETLKIEMPNYSSGYLSYEINIPFIKPYSIIMIPYYNNEFNESNATITALSYFFNSPSNNLIYNWSLNGQSGSSVENPNILQISIPKGSAQSSTLSISLESKNIDGNQDINNSTNILYQ